LWWINQPTLVALAAREAIADPSNETFVSAASVWEAAIKTAAGRLTTPTPLIEAAPVAGLIELPVRWGHAVRAASLPLLHRDPFDRMLVAQAIEHGMLLLTRDPVVQQYAAPTMAA
jgi:PIN domain nuclease of toxin-antitoxin system